MARSIDLNADLGEGFPNDRALLRLVSSASVCCGAHAGDPLSIRQTLRWAREFGVVVGAHPGYRDREGFGRRERVMPAGHLDLEIAEQIAELTTWGAMEAVPIRFLKPHGALYNQAQREADVARVVLTAALTSNLPLLGQPGTLLESLAGERGVRFVPEGFPDRRYRPDGSLVPRTEPGAVLHDPREIEEQVLRLAEEGRVATLCIHGDEPAAVANADRVRRILENGGIVIRGFLD